MARNALSFGSSSAAGGIQSTYHKQKKEIQENDSREKKTGKCPKCDKEFYLFKFFKSSKKYNEKPFATCIDCKPPAKRRDNKNGPGDWSRNTRTEGDDSAIYSSMGAITNGKEPVSSIDSFQGNPTYVTNNNSDLSDRIKKSVTWINITCYIFSTKGK